MPDKEMVSAKIANRTKERLDNYADREGISRSQAIGMILKQGLDVEESDMRLVPVKSDGGTKMENKIDQTQQEVEELQSNIDEIAEGLWNMRPSLLIALLWLVIESTGLMSPVAVGISGIGIIGLVVANYLWVIRHG
jgi:antitoxin component of RelBE/YafQ-DinJ toxin-antitoxin module